MPPDAKQGQRYKLTNESRVFLNRGSAEYLGDTIEFLLSPMLTEAFRDVTSVVRSGTTALPHEGIITPRNPLWLSFARTMGPMATTLARRVAELVDPYADRKLRILDIAAGHGMFGIALAERNPRLEVTALDWPEVLEIARVNAQKVGITDRYFTKVGNAFDLEYGSGYDLVLLTNFLHHFDPLTCGRILRKIRSALADNGRAVTVEFIPNEDRVSPPESAQFSLLMLCSTPQGNAYTFPEIKNMFSGAGFSSNEIHSLGDDSQQVVISRI